MPEMTFSVLSIINSFDFVLSLDSSLHSWNIRGLNGSAKREEVVDAFRKGKFELLALKYTK